MTLTNDDVAERLDFARRRLNDIRALIAANTLGTELHLRQQLAQEFFFHAVGAVDVLAQLVNERRLLGLDSEEVSITAVANKLPPNDPLVPALRNLYSRTRGQPLPPDPYSPDGYLFRLYNYRHQVTHRRRNPFRFRLSSPSPSFALDPRDFNGAHSTKTCEDDMQEMLDLAGKRCAEALNLV
jgi:hypothetical protein